MTGDAAAGAPRPVTPVGILGARLAALARAVERGEWTGAALVHELDDLAGLADGVERYPAAHTSPESAALAAIVARTHDHDWGSTDPRGLGLEQEMVSGHLEGRLLRMLVAATGAVNVLEIGMFTGYSALAMAEALPADGRLIACEIHPDVAAFAQRGFDESPDGARIEVRVGPAADTLTALIRDERIFDLVFLDADKRGYRTYVDTVLSGGLLADDGLLCIDNTLLQGQPWNGPRTPNGAAIAEFNEWLTADRRVEQVLVPVRDGLTLARRVAAGRAR